MTDATAQALEAAFDILARASRAGVDQLRRTIAQWNGADSELRHLAWDEVRRIAAFSESAAADLEEIRRGVEEWIANASPLAQSTAYGVPRSERTDLVRDAAPAVLDAMVATRFAAGLSRGDFATLTEPWLEIAT